MEDEGGKICCTQCWDMYNIVVFKSDVCVQKVDDLGK